MIMKWRIFISSEFYIGIDKLNISMDSWYEEEHDEVRQKKGAYKQAWNTVNLCRKVGMQIHVFFTKKKSRRRFLVCD